MYEENQKLKTWITPDLATEYLAGAVLLGAAPCTAMVFVWSTLTKGNPAYTVVQVASNDIIILFAFVPIVKFLLGVSNVSVPFQTLFMSVVLFVVIPLAAGIITRLLVVRKKGTEYSGTFAHADTDFYVSGRGGAGQSTAHYIDCSSADHSDILYILSGIWSMQNYQTSV